MVFLISSLLLKAQSSVRLREWRTNHHIINNSVQVAVVCELRVSPVKGQFLASVLYSLLLLLLLELEFDLRVSCLQRRISTAWSIPVVHFILIILEMRSHKLFASAVLKPQAPDLSLQSSKERRCETWVPKYTHFWQFSSLLTTSYCWPQLALRSVGSHVSWHSLSSINPPHLWTHRWKIQDMGFYQVH